MTTETTAPAAENSSRLVAIISYALLLLACTTGFTGIVAVVLAYVKRDDARGTVFESHFSNVITVFWAAVAFFVLLMAAIGFGAVRLFSMPEPQPDPQIVAFAVGAWGAMVLFAVWYLYRTIKGLVRAIDGKPY